MIRNIAKKETSYLDAYSGTIRHKIKILNFNANGTRTAKLDRQCITPVNTLITEGMELSLSDGSILIVSYKEADWYKKLIIRYVLDCVNTNQKVDIFRNTLTKSAQGGLNKQEDVKVYTSIPVKIGLYEAIDAKDINLTLPKYVMYLSINYTLQSGDRIVISDTTFEVAKVNSFLHVTPGLMEVRFDKDPRWL